MSHTDRRERSGVKAKLLPQNLNTEVLTVLEVEHKSRELSSRKITQRAPGEKMITGNYAAANAL